MNKLTLAFKTFCCLIFLFFQCIYCMEFYSDEISTIIAVWVNKKREVKQLMLESEKLQSPKYYYEKDVLKAIFNWDENRVTIYGDYTCYCIFYDHFLSGIEMHALLLEELKELGTTKIDGKKRCAIN